MLWLVLNPELNDLEPIRETSGTVPYCGAQACPYLGLVDP